MLQQLLTQSSDKTVSLGTSESPRAQKMLISTSSLQTANNQHTIVRHYSSVKLETLGYYHNSTLWHTDHNDRILVAVIRRSISEMQSLWHFFLHTTSLSTPDSRSPLQASTVHTVSKDFYTRNITNRQCHRCYMTNIYLHFSKVKCAYGEQLSPHSHWKHWQQLTCPHAALPCVLMSPQASNAAVARAACDTRIAGWKSNLIKETTFWRY